MIGPPPSQLLAMSDQSSSASRFSRLPETWRYIELKADEKAQGVYGIYHVQSDRFYVGSSVEIGNRLGKHLADLRRSQHHAAKLQRQWSLSEIGFKFLLIEIIDDSRELRFREQFWIEELQAFSHGFNSKSVAEGQEPSTLKHIEVALNNRWPRYYEKYRPDPSRYIATSDERVAYNAAWRRIATIRAALAVVGAVVLLKSAPALHNIFGTEAAGVVMAFEWVLGLPLLIAYVMSGWPTRPEIEAQVRLDSACQAARIEADRETVAYLSEALNIPIDKMWQLYRDAPRQIEERDRKRNYYRRLNWRFSRMRE